MIKKGYHKNYKALITIFVHCSICRIVFCLKNFKGIVKNAMLYVKTFSQLAS